MSSKEEYLRDIPKCEECGKARLFYPHYEHCSQYKHIVDDHYDSACSRGTCKHCFPDYVPKFMVSLTQEEKDVLELIRTSGLDYPKIHGIIQRTKLANP